MHTPQNSGKMPSTTSPLEYHHDTGPHAPKSPSHMGYPIPQTDSRLHMSHIPDHAQPETTLYSFAESTSQFPESRQSLDSALSPGYETDAESEAITSHTMPVTTARSTEEGQHSSSRKDSRWEQRNMAVSADYHTQNLQPLPAQHNVRVTASLPPRPRPILEDVRSSSHQLHPYVSALLIYSPFFS